MLNRCPFISDSCRFFLFMEINRLAEKSMWRAFGEVDSQCLPGELQGALIGEVSAGRAKEAQIRDQGRAGLSVEPRNQGQQFTAGLVLHQGLQADAAVTDGAAGEAHGALI